MGSAALDTKDESGVETLVGDREIVLEFCGVVVESGSGLGWLISSVGVTSNVISSSASMRFHSQMELDQNVHV